MADSCSLSSSLSCTTSALNYIRAHRRESAASRRTARCRDEEHADPLDICSAQYSEPSTPASRQSTGSLSSLPTPSSASTLATVRTYAIPSRDVVVRFLKRWDRSLCDFDNTRLCDMLVRAVARCRSSGCDSPLRYRSLPPCYGDEERGLSDFLYEASKPDNFVAAGDAGTAVIHSSCCCKAW